MRQKLEHMQGRIISEESGFSLVELLVVVLIISILAVAVTPVMFSQRDAARNSNAITTMTVAEQSLTSNFALNDETLGSDTTSLAAAMNSLQGGENSITWVAAGASYAGPAGDAASDDKKVYLYSVKATRYGGVAFCVAGKGDKNYCAAVFGNGPSERYTIGGTSTVIDSSANGIDSDAIVLGDNNTMASFKIGGAGGSSFLTAAKPAGQTRVAGYKP